MKKIGFVISEFVLGGAERVLSELSLALAKEHEIKIIVFDNKNMYYDYGGTLININIPANEKGILSKVNNIIKRTKKLKEIFKKEQFDEIYAFMESASWPTLLADRNTSISIHCNPDYLSTFEQYAIKFLYPKAKRIISISKGVTHILKNKYNIKHVQTIYNPINFKSIKYLSKEKILPEIKKPYIIATGRLNYIKRFDLLINAYAKAKMSKECNLLILGSGELYNDLQKQINQLNISEKIKLLGYKKNPFKYIKQAEFLVLSSDSEGYPMSLIEALSLQCPVISTDCPTGPNEIITHKENGLLVPVNDITALAKAMDSVYFDETLKQHFKQNSQKSIEHLKIENIKQQWLALGEVA